MKSRPSNLAKFIRHLHFANYMHSIQMLVEISATTSIRDRTAASDLMGLGLGLSMLARAQPWSFV
jgi:hypothetical protein